MSKSRLMKHWMEFFFPCVQDKGFGLGYERFQVHVTSRTKPQREKNLNKCINNQNKTKTKIKNKKKT